MNQKETARKIAFQFTHPQEDATDVNANNQLEFLIDPTVIPVRQRLYFRPEEILRNEDYEGSKAEAQKAYGDQRHNSDFYPIRNRTKSQKEGSLMDRRTLIASLDILSKNFTESDPIATDLRTMAYVVSKMGDEELQSRMAAEAPEMSVEAKASTFPCPKCGTKVLEQTSYCVKCKKKVKPGKKAAEEEICPTCGKNPCACVKEASEEVIVKDYWTKEASDAVARALAAEVTGAIESPVEEQQEEYEKSETPAEEKKEEGKEAGKIKGPGVPDGTGPMSGTPKCQMNKKEDKEAAGQNDPRFMYQGKKPAVEPKAEVPVPAEVPAPVAEPKKEEEVEAKKVVAPVVPAPEEKKEEVEAKKEVPAPVAEPKKEEETVVDTKVLAAEKFDDVELVQGMLASEDIGELSASEKAQLDQLFK